MTSDRRHPRDRRRPALILSRDPDTADLYVLALRGERTGLLSVASDDEALQLLRDRSVSAVLVDVSDPGHDWEICGRLVRQADGAVPVIVLTGWIDDAAQAQAFTLGCAAFVAKPATPQRVAEALQRTRAGERRLLFL